MNKIYKTVWNASLACVQVVSELASAHGGGGSSVGLSGLLQRFAVFNLALLPIVVLAAIDPNALPQGGNITQGQGQIQQQGNVLNVNQHSQHLNTQWNSFNIGKDATVNFNQPNSSAIAVNQVLDNNASQIMGRLNANGQVFLLNPNGVIFSKTAQVNVGGLVASTLKLSEQDALTGRFKLSGDANGTGRVENHGSIIANGGTVALIAPNIVNTGTIKTPNGITHLTAANQVTLALQDGSLTQYQVDQGVVQGLVDNQGAIIADNGAVYLTAKGKDALSRAVVNHSGIIEANRLTQNAKGEIILLADMGTGITNVTGRLSVQGMNGQDGGFIETSAAAVKIGDATRVNTSAEQGGKTGLWLIDPTDFTIAASGGDITGATVATNLATTNFKIESITGTTTGAGDIHVNDTITWSSDNDLTLSAQNNININKSITASGANAGLNLEYGLANVEAGNTSDYYLNNGAKVNLQAGQNFSTKQGSNGNTVSYTVITALGAQNSLTATDLQGINGKLDGNYVLGTDIDASSTTTWQAAFGGSGFDPLGNTLSGSVFTGRFDGLGHDINKLYINLPLYNEVGLFRYVKNGSIRNVNVYDASIGARNDIGIVAGVNDGGSISNVNTSGNLYLLGNNGFIRSGGVVGSNYKGSISAAHANVSWQSMLSVNNVEAYVGGVVGYNTGTISDASGQLQAVVNMATNKSVYLGGLVGYSSGNISDSQATGDMVINHTYNGSIRDSIYVGGLVGHSSGNISNSHATGTVTANSAAFNANAGGLVGRNEANISNSYATGAVTAKAASGEVRVGGFVGFNYYGSISNSHASGDVSADSFSYFANAGGLVGENKGSISNSHASGVVSAIGTSHSALAGGLVGVNRGSISNSYATGAVTANSSNLLAIAGGLVGTNDQGSINNSHATGAVTSNATNDIAYAGGLVGFSYYGSISNSHASGKVTAQANDTSAGGLIGLNGQAQVNGSHATGDVSGNNHVGGLIGSNGGAGYIGGSISNAYATGNVTGKGDQVGGLIGYNKTGNLSNVYAAGNVTGRYQVGGLVGLNENGNISNAETKADTEVRAHSIAGGLVGENMGNGSSTGLIKQATARGALWGVTGANTANAIAGGLVGINHSMIANSRAEGLVTTSEASNEIRLGGLVGENLGSIANSVATGITRTNATASKTALVGGLVGVNRGQIASSRASGDYEVRLAIFDSNAMAIGGGLVGDNQGSITASSASSNTSAGSGALLGKDYFGGLVGRNSGTISNASASGSVSAAFGTSTMGGLIAYNQGGSVSQVSASGTVTGKSNVGGLIGLNENANISNASTANTSVVTGTGAVGGLIGNNYSSGGHTVSNSYALGEVKGGSSGDNIGGLIGRNQNASISNVYATGAVTGRNQVGGLIGYNYSGGGHTVSNSYALGEVKGGSSGDNIGGFIGHNQNASISNVYAAGAVTGRNQVGGLLGLNENANISNASTANTSVVTGTGTGTGEVGGLIGANYSNGGHTVSNSYALGEVQGGRTGDNIGGLIGRNQNAGISNAYAVGAVTGRNQVGGLIGYNQDGNISMAHTESTSVVSGMNRVGGLVGNNYSSNVATLGLIEGVYAQGRVEAKSANGEAIAGGLVGLNWGNISNSHATGTVTANSSSANAYAGGLVGFNDNSTISNSHATGAVTANASAAYAYAGGLVGKSSGNISNSHASGNVTANAEGGVAYAGGLVAYNTQGDMTDTQATGTVTAHSEQQYSYAAGLVAYNTNGNILNATSSGDVSASSNLGWTEAAGLVAYHENGRIHNAHVRGSVTARANTGEAYAAGLVGFNRSVIEQAQADGDVRAESNLSNAYAGGAVAYNSQALSGVHATGNVSAHANINTSQAYVGGLVGWHESGQIDDSHATGIVVAQAAKTFAGGLIGLNRNGQVTNSFASGDVSGNNHVGGLIGANGDAQSNGGNVSNAYATGDVSGTDDQVGGLIGYNKIGNLSNVYAAGKVTGRNQVGGLVGWNENSQVSNAHTTADVSGANEVGGLIGRNAGSPATALVTVKNSYAQGDVEAKNTDASVHAGGLVGYNAYGSIDNSYAHGNVKVALTVTPAAAGMKNIDVSAGGLLGRNDAAGSFISNSHATGDVSIDVVGNGNPTMVYALAGGLVGLHGQAKMGSISNSHATGAVSARSNLGRVLAGGLAGASYGDVYDSYAKGAVHVVTSGLAEKVFAGGLLGAGYAPNAGMLGAPNFIHNSHASGDVTVEATVNSASAGGLVGIASSYLSAIANSHATGNVSMVATAGNANTFAGGLIGQNSQAPVRNSHATGNVTGPNNVGGLIGLNGDEEVTFAQGGYISNSYATGNVTGLDHIGGLIGYNQYSILKNVQATGAVTGRDHVGGLVGSFIGYYGEMYRIDDSFATGKVVGANHVGGLIGSNGTTDPAKGIGGFISNVYATGGVTGTGDKVGGLIGYHQKGSVNIAYASGTVSSNGDAVGGLVGLNENSSISNAYAVGAVTGRNQVGGLVGNSVGSSSIAQTYARGLVTGTSNVGGLIGSTDATTQVASSFWDTQSSAQNSSAGGAGANGVSTAQIMDVNTFINAGWDIDDVGGTGKVWRIYSGQTAPLLRNFLTQKTINAGADNTITYDAQQHSFGATTGVDANVLQQGTGTGTNVNVYDLVYYSHQQGYDLVGDRDSRLTINKAALTVTANNANKVYDATAYAGGNGVSYSGFVGGETASVLGGAVTYSGTSQGAKNAGTYVIDAGGLSSGNYDITYQKGDLTIGKANLTLQAATDTRTYDGTTNSAQQVIVTGLMGNDALTNLSQSFDNRNAGSRDLSVDVGYVVNDGNGGGNYNVVENKASGTINKANLTLQAATDNRTYDGTTNSKGAVTYAGLVAGDSVTGLSQSFDNRNAGSRDLLVDAGYVVNDGNGGGNYNVIENKASGTINKANLTLQAATDSRTYDGTTNSKGAVTYSGLVAGDSVSGLSQSFDSRNAGSRDLSVNAGYVVNDGNGGGNYNVVENKASGTINKANLTLQAATDNRTYDGTTNSAKQVIVTGLMGNDALTNLSQSFDSRNAGSRDLLVNAGYVVNDGNAGGNYNVVVNKASGTINKANLTLQAATDTRTYDGTTNSNVAVTVAGLVAGDSVTGLSQSFDSRNAGSRDLLVDAGYVVNDGNGGGNYNVVENKASGTINKANLVLQAATDSRTYDGTTNSKGAVTYAGLVAGDSVTGLSQSFDSRNAGSRDLSVNAGYVVNDGNGGGNYNVIENKASGTINKANLVLQAASDSRTYDGTTNSKGAVTYSGLVAGDSVTGLSQSFDSRNAGSRDLLVDTGYVVDDGNGGNNYVVVSQNASGQIDKAKLSSIADIAALNRDYNGLLDVALDYSKAHIVGTIFGSDDVTVAQTGTGTMANKNAGSSKLVSISGLSLSGADAGNYELDNSSGQTTVDIDKASIGKVTGLKGIDRQINASTDVGIDVSGAHLSNVVAGDQVFISAAQGSLANNQVGTQQVSITDIDLAGADASNYEWDGAPTTTTVNIAAVPTVPPTVAPTARPQMQAPTGNPYRRAIDFDDEDKLKNPLNGNPVHIEIIGNGVNTNGIQTLSGGLR
ncbi:YDG domain-containing protein [Vitreoscilla massiliensis]|uniref:YDG domain-containing protein n=1 Tax=Vitreoscilla massiliensis TaxID=1689272 RepID=A0ABY4DZU0_9NEIS|nr:GLUG motif-containing protein [Vitreoscilla massiliensis]UOO89064.1 YDG domain-containing protein [Vitreoscilla massiliensis]